MIVPQNIVEPAPDQIEQATPDTWIPLSEAAQNALAALAEKMRDRESQDMVVPEFEGAR